MLTSETIQRARVATDLLSYISRTHGPYTRAGSTDGGEYAGPCPFCGGRDRFRIWPASDPPHWWCRRCEQHGDLIAFVQSSDGMSFADAVAELLGGAVDHGPAGPPPALAPPDDDGPPPPAWRAGAQAFANACYDALWRPEGGRARAFLFERYGLSEATVEQAGLGYHAAACVASRAAWGLPPDDQGRDGLYLPPGIVIPWEVAGQTWRLFVRRNTTDPKRKYYQIPGGANCPYRADSIESGRPVLMAEAALDALAVRQAAGDLVAAVAVGTTGARRMRWIMRLARAPLVLLAFDADGGGEAPTRYWGEVLQNAVPWAPYYDDPAAMLRDGMDVRAWVEAGLAYGREQLREAA